MGCGMLREMKVKLSNYRKNMLKLISRRDVSRVRKYSEVRWDYLRLLEKQEICWRQRAKQFWLCDGDNNTRLFHKYASTGKEHNKIKD